MFIAGLTGNYGMGKSFVLLLFRDLGAVTIESDKVVDKVLKEAKVLSNMKDLLGPEVFDHKGRLDKRAVAERIFSDATLRKGVEVILHPLVFEKVDKLLAAIRDKESLVIVEVPLLFEGGYRERFRKVITVYTAEETAIERLKAAGVPRRDTIMRLNSQMPISRKKELADYTIDNSGSREETRQQVREVYTALLEDMEKQRSP
ncbi:MAG: dephospho-CoA kinase [Candidatus Sulfobium sp.]